MSKEELDRFHPACIEIFSFDDFRHDEREFIYTKMDEVYRAGKEEEKLPYTVSELKKDYKKLKANLSELQVDLSLTKYRESQLKGQVTRLKEIRDKLAEPELTKAIKALAALL